MSERPLLLITGGNGFIGSHLARRMDGEYRVRIVDIAGTSNKDVLIGDLCDFAFCKKIVRDVDVVIHCAAVMGGMGVIHHENDLLIYKKNHLMTTNLLTASLAAGVGKFLFASSACVYPDSLQTSSNVDVSLREESVMAEFPPKPQGDYGLEKLQSELLLLNHHSPSFKVYIARFHNIFGPGGAWNSGYEKAPAALLRKAIATQLLQSDGDDVSHMEIWGSGDQRRSFLYIDDCVDAVSLLLNSDYHLPLNIGSDRSITVRDLAMLAIRVAGASPDTSIRELHDKPTGVASRNSNNDLICKTLEWSPQISLEDGIERTGKWMNGEVASLVEGKSPEQRRAVLHSLLTSEVVHLEKVYAILLPITSRFSQDPSNCLGHLKKFAVSLRKTTMRETDHLDGGVSFRLKVYVAIDDDDEYLLQPSNKVEEILEDAGFEVTTLICSRPKGHVCALWRDLAHNAWEDKCDYFVLMGDDVVLEDDGWLTQAHQEFQRISRDEQVPLGFGCVAFTDVSFPGMPTFPIIHRTHLDIFKGQVIPDIFINQDGDPYLYQLYRRWGCSQMIPSRLRNSVGGSASARYEKKHATGWTFGTLHSSAFQVTSWLTGVHFSKEEKLTLDVVIPCYRVMVDCLDRMLELKASKTCTVMFIVIIDNPLSPNIQELEEKYGHRPDIRIRVNSANLGASASRNRGLEESAADWVHFLDDDVVPDSQLLIEAEKIIRAHPSAAGFVGNSQFPLADSIFTTAIRLSSVTYFWDIATKIEDNVPWGVTANLIVRRDDPNISFDLSFPKTGGGEDIDYCLKKRDANKEGFYGAPNVKVEHPWWNGGKRSYRRFFRWARGDGGLLALYPQHTFYDFAPNSSELTLLCGIGLLVGLVTGQTDMAVIALKAEGSVILSTLLSDTYLHCYRDAAEARYYPSSIHGLSWIVAIQESVLIRMASEMGRIVGTLERKEWLYLGRRFDWFTYRWGGVTRATERMRNLWRAVLMGLIFWLVMF